MGGAGWGGERRLQGATMSWAVQGLSLGQDNVAGTELQVWVRVVDLEQEYNSMDRTH